MRGELTGILVSKVFVDAPSAATGTEKVSSERRRPFAFPRRYEPDQVPGSALSPPVGRTPLAIYADCTRRDRLVKLCVLALTLPLALALALALALTLFTRH